MQRLVPSRAAVEPSTVMGAVASGFASFVSGRGHAVENIFECAAINPDILREPNQPMSLQAFLGAIDAAAQVTGDDNFGLWLGHQFRPEYLGLWGYVGLSSATLGEALVNMVRYFPHFQSRSSLTLGPGSRGTMRLEYRLLDGRIVSRRHDAELTLGNVFNVMRRALGERWSPLEVNFSHPRPDAWHDHARAFRAEVRFDRPANAIVFPSSDLSRAMPGADPQLLLIAMQGFKALQLSRALRSSVTDRVRSEVVELIHTGVPRLEQVAERLGMAGWTLGRQLRDEGRPFSELVEDVRRELACHYLERSTLNISRLAELLGYAETSGFSHAFARWFGESPRRWRERHRGPAGEA